MKDFLRSVFKRPELFYPPLIAAFPLLFLYVHNEGELSASDIAVPIAMAVVCSAILMTLLWLILRSTHKAALGTTLFVILFYSYGRAYDALEGTDLNLPGHPALLPAALLAWGYMVYFIKLARSDFRTLSRFLLAVAAALVTFNLAAIAFDEAKVALARWRVDGGSKQGVIASGSGAKVEELPDIYLIILDEYAHPDVMREYYDYDSGDFLDYLRGKGFFVAEESTTRTPHTEEALASMFNMRHLSRDYYWDSQRGDYLYPEERDGEAIESQRWEKRAHEAMADSAVVNSLKSQGYIYHYIGNILEKEKWSSLIRSLVDFYYDYGDRSTARVRIEFQRILYETTMLKPFYFLLAGRSHENLFRKSLTDLISKLNEIPYEEGPKFVMVHIYSPHDPFVFGPNGEHVEASHFGDFSNRQYYMGQYIFITKQIEKLVDSLQSRSKSPPVIVILSDHGLRPHHRGVRTGEDDWRRIFYAIYIPDADSSEFSNSMKPIDTFRVIFNRYKLMDYSPGDGGLSK